MTSKQEKLQIKRIAPGEKVRLADIAADDTGARDKKQAKEDLRELGQQLKSLQELLYATSTHSMLIVLQGMDTSGKDGTIRHVLKYCNPQGNRIESFKAPTDQELAHDFLWRVHRVTPPHGMIAVFNRSHYEDVLAARVLKLVPDSVWKQRYEQINDFEKLLTQNKTIVVKLFLHISKKEQEERLLAREEEVEKAWKLSVGDWEQREKWKAYQRAYEEALGRCSTEQAPWWIIPADKKWFRNLTAAQVLVDALQPYEKEWREILETRSKKSLEELKAYRAGSG